MAIIEVELARLQFVSLVELLVSAAPIPRPTFPVLAPDRLVSSLHWTQVDADAVLAGFAPPPGTVLLSAQLAIWHVSIAELRANPGALGQKTDTTAMLLVRLTPAGLVIDLVALAAANQPPQLLGPIQMASEPLDIGDGPPPALASIVGGGDYFTLRFGTSPADAAPLLLPPANRLAIVGGQWLIRVSPEAFVDRVVATLGAGLTPPPSGTTIEEQPSGAWGYISDRNEWGVRASAGIEKKDACPGLFGAVDLSVDVNVIAAFSTDTNQGVLRMSLNISSDASDWDSVRCWLGSGAIAGTLLGGIGGAAIAFGVHVGSLIAIGEIVRLSAGEEVAGTSPGGDMTLVSQDDTSATYSGTTPLPAFPRASISAAVVNADGLMVSGQMLLAAAQHEPDFLPNGGAVPSSWHGHYSCGNRRWEQEYLLQSISIADRTTILGQPFRAVPVAVFSTTAVEPASMWGLTLPDRPALDQFVGFQAINPQPGNAGLAFVHTSAGIRRFDFTPVPVRPPQPDDVMLGIMQVNCRKWYEMFDLRDELHWLPDPPPFEGIAPAVRQWLITIERLAPGAELMINRRGPREEEPIRITADTAGGAAIEFLTDADTTVSIERTRQAGSVNARVTQRWIVPMRVWPAPAGTAQLAVRRGRIVLGAPDAELEVHPDLGPVPREMAGSNRTGLTRGVAVAGARPALPFSVTLRDGRVAAFWRNQLIVGRPWRMLSTGAAAAGAKEPAST
jgi:hypothetical protein